MVAPWRNTSTSRNTLDAAKLTVYYGLYVGLTTLPPSWAVVSKSGRLSLLERSGPVQACYGTTVPLSPHHGILDGREASEAYIACSGSTQNFHGSLPLPQIYITNTQLCNANRLGGRYLFQNKIYKNLVNLKKIPQPSRNTLLFYYF